MGIPSRVKSMSLTEIRIGEGLAWTSNTGGIEMIRAGDSRMENEKGFVLKISTNPSNCKNIVTKPISWLLALVLRLEELER